GGLVKIELLEREIRKLTANDRARLYTSLGLSETYKANRNVPRHFEDWIELEDSSAHYKEKPQIRVRYRSVNDSELGEDLIDIIDFIKNDPRCIGHPFILFAIIRWTAIVEWTRSLARKDTKQAEKY